ncbi:MAG: DUF885 domain-containing protein [Dermatophilaceae bacterium]
MSGDSARARTEIDAIADGYVDAVVALSPITATSLGISGHDAEYDDFSPAGFAALSDARRETLRRIDATSCVDAVDEVTVEAMRERLGLQEESHAAHLDLAQLNNIASPLQSMRDILDLMPTGTDEQVATLAARLHRLPAALAGWHDSLREAVDHGRLSPRRQVLACITQARDVAAPDGYFVGLERLARQHPAQSETLRSGIAAARSGYDDTATWLGTLVDLAPTHDGCGRETYELCSRAFLGARVDLEETYEWGQQELARIAARIHEVARTISPGATPAEAADRLDGDPAYRIEGTDALQRWMQERADEAIAELADVHFDIPEPVRRIECCIAPTQTGGIYYTEPSDDFSRPGRMWWSVPRGMTTFGTWRELTTVYHEGVPGHHLQIGQAVARSESLNRWRRLMSWTSGHGEGWALYAERLMEELGFMEDPGNRLGLLDGQSLRAARVVLDIGVHCGFPPPPGLGGRWTYDVAWSFLRANSLMPEPILRFELDRYLGWPGQAPSYKIGERVWLDVREQMRRPEGSAVDLRDFHRRALNLGGLGLDTFRAAMVGGTG